MKNLIIATVIGSALFGCASLTPEIKAAQSKIADIREKIECRVEAVLPVVKYLESKDLELVLTGTDISEIPAVQEAGEEALKKVVADLKACK